MRWFRCGRVGTRQFRHVPEFCVWSPPHPAHGAAVGGWDECARRAGRTAPDLVCVDEPTRQRFLARAADR